MPGDFSSHGKKTSVKNSPTKKKSKLKTPEGSRRIPYHPQGSLRIPKNPKSKVLRLYIHVHLKTSQLRWISQEIPQSEQWETSVFYSRRAIWEARPAEKTTKKNPWNEQQVKHLKMDGWNTIVSFWGPAYFQGRTVSFREGNHLQPFAGYIFVGKMAILCKLSSSGEAPQQLANYTLRIRNPSLE